MTVAVKTVQYTGATATKSDLTTNTLYMCMKDAAVPGVQGAMPIPDGSAVLSWIKQIALEVTVAPGTSLTDIYIYPAEANPHGANTELLAGEQFVAVGSYVQAAGSWVQGTAMDSIYPAITSQVDVWDLSESSPLGPIDQIATTGTGVYTKLVILQEKLAVGATAGVRSGGSIYWAFLVIE